jgi:hypothetical protein
MCRAGGHQVAIQSTNDLVFFDASMLRELVMQWLLVMVPWYLQAATAENSISRLQQFSVPAVRSQAFSKI